MNVSVRDINYETYRPELIKRLRAFLLLAEEKYVKYLNVLEKQEDDILKEDSVSLIMHQDLVETVLREISVLEKSIRPMERELAERDDEFPPEISSIREKIENLRQKAVFAGDSNIRSLNEVLSSINKKIPTVRFKRTPGFSSGIAPDSKYINLSV